MYLLPFCVNSSRIVKQKKPMYFQYFYFFLRHPKTNLELKVRNFECIGFRDLQK